jgi:hypothetical protein
MDFVKEYNDVFGNNFCLRIINKFEAHDAKTQGTTINGVEKGKITMDLHSDHWNSESWDIIYSVLKDTLDKHVLCYYNELGEKFHLFNVNEDSGFLIQKYTKDIGLYDFHHDFHIDNRGFRSLTYIFYLNNVEQGGETEFYNGIKIKAERGKLIFFPSSWNYVHRGNTPLSCNKYIITGFVYSRL